MVARAPATAPAQPMRPAQDCRAHFGNPSRYRAAPGAATMAAAREIRNNPGDTTNNDE